MLPQTAAATGGDNAKVCAMARVMAVEFQPHGQLHFLAPGPASADCAVGDRVLYPTDDGREIATVAWHGDAELPDGVPVCAGPADDKDLARDRANRQRRADAAAVAELLIAQHGLAMKLLAVDFVDQSSEFDKLTVFYYQASKRVDFRALLGDLVRAVHSRVDLRQVGARDAARLTGGIGPCGRPLCCASMLTVDPVSLRLARQQDFIVSAAQRCGICGHAMCCLRYEAADYDDFHARAPKIGTRVSIPGGEGMVDGFQVPAESVTVRIDSGERISCPLADVSPGAGGSRNTEGSCACAKIGAAAAQDAHTTTPHKPRKPRMRQRLRQEAQEADA